MLRKREKAPKFAAFFEPYFLTGLFVPFEYARCPEFFHIVVVAVGAGLDLPRVARFAVQEG